MLDLQIRKMRAELNKSLQSRRTVKDIQAEGVVFEGKYGNGIWGCRTFGEETFGSLYNAHLQRERENEQDAENDRDREENIMTLIDSTTTAKEWWDLKWFIDRKPKLLDNFLVTDALEERRLFHDIPEEE